MRMCVCVCVCVCARVFHFVLFHRGRNHRKPQQWLPIGRQTGIKVELLIVFLQLFISFLFFFFKVEFGIDSILIFILLKIFFCFFRAAASEYGSSQDKGRIRAQLLAYTTATATQDLSHVYDLHGSSPQCRMLNPLSEARD